MTKKGDGGGKGGRAGKAGAASPGDTRKPKHSNDANRSSKGPANQRTAATVRRLNMYKKRPKRDKNGRMLHEDLQSKELPSTRIQPDRRWFGNTRVIGQKQLESFRTEMSTKVNDAYTVLLREKKLPLQLLEDPEQKLKGKVVRHNLIASQPFQDTFGTAAKRKRPRLAVESLADLVTHVDDKAEKFEEVGPREVGFREPGREAVFDKGQSRRIWGELYKVLDSSDVIIQVLDARDPMGTRCRFLEQHIRKHLRHKHLLLLLNKCDLVPSWVTKRWLHYLSREFPTLAFHASITNPFGKGALLSLLRQLARLRTDKQAISVGFVGYPNVGKSSVINTLRTKAVCKTAPVPGETKVWQYITLMKRIFLIDCPGVVYNKAKDTDSDAVLKGVVRVENLEDATEHVVQVLQRVKPEYLRRAYKIKSWTDHEDFLTQLGRLSGKLLRGGDADLNTAARMVLYDWQRGKIPFFSLPPGHTDDAPPKPNAKAAAGTAPDAQQGSIADPAATAGEGGAAQQDGGLEMLPTPAEAVTEEDAVQEAGARPEDAAAAARAARELLSSALAMQARTRIPVQQDYFLPEDDPQGAPGAVEDEDVIEGDEGGSEEGDASPEDEHEPDAAEAGGPSNVPAVPVVASKRPREPAEDSGDDSDGYGEAGLSWEAVMTSIQGGKSDGAVLAPAQPPHRVDAGTKPPRAPAVASRPGRKAGKAGAAAQPAAQPEQAAGGAGKRKGQADGAGATARRAGGAAAAQKRTKFARLD